jgi:hypothetical protein
VKRLFRTVPAPQGAGKQNDGDIRQRRIEITVERETVTVMRSGGPVPTAIRADGQTRCACCGEAVAPTAGENKVLRGDGGATE